MFNMKFPNELLPFVGFSSLVYCLLEGQESTLVEYLKVAPLG